jgi:hypothetical protein
VAFRIGAPGIVTPNVNGNPRFGAIAPYGESAPPPPPPPVSEDEGVLFILAANQNINDAGAFVNFGADPTALTDNGFTAGQFVAFELFLVIERVLNFSSLAFNWPNGEGFDPTSDSYAEARWIHSDTLQDTFDGRVNQTNTTFNGLPAFGSVGTYRQLGNARLSSPFGTLNCRIDPSTGGEVIVRDGSWLRVQRAT